MYRKAFSPGDVVPDNACFWVHHYQHRLPHLGRTVFRVFPSCATCGAKVRFEPVVVAEDDAQFLRYDSDFKPAWEQYLRARSKQKAAD